MMIFQVDRYYDDIFVYKDGELFLKVIRRSNFWNQISAEFYAQDKLVLKTTANLFFFGSYYKIRYSVDNLLLEKNDGKHYLLSGTNFFYQEWNSWKKPNIFLYENHIKKAVIDIPFLSIFPIKYKVKFEKESDNVLYLLFIFLIQMPKL